MADSSPLNGLRILVTRSRKQAGEFGNVLEALGAQVVAVPLISISPPDSWEALDAAFAQLDKYDWIIFASANSVESCLSRIKQLGIDKSQFKKTKLAAIGPATKEALIANDLHCHFTPSKFIAEGLIEEFPQYPNLNGMRILWPRTNVGRNYMLEKLQEAGAVVDVAPSYQTSAPADKEAIADRLASLLSEKSVDVITLLSAQTCLNFSELLSLGLDRATNGATTHARRDALLDQVIIASIGPETSKAATEQLGKVDVEASQFTRQGLVQSLVDYVKNTSKTVKNH